MYAEIIMCTNVQCIMLKLQVRVLNQLVYELSRIGKLYD